MTFLWVVEDGWAGGRGSVSGKEANGYRHARDNIDERLRSGERGSDMLQSFIDAGLSRFELEQEMFVET